jgi:hypothetical protein
MIVKVTTYVKLEGHPENIKELTSTLSKAVCDHLSTTDLSEMNNGETKALIKKWNPKLTRISFLSHEDVLENLRRSS